jgi:Undecaprenyl-phosphate glucose phosphotransferase
MAAFSVSDLRHVDHETPVNDDKAAVRSGQLSALAESLASYTPPPAYSRVVISGVVRFVEFALVALSGFLVEMIHVVPDHGYQTAYLFAIPSVAALTVVMFQMLGAYRISALRFLSKEYLHIACGWALVFLIALTAVFFLKLDSVFSRIWLSGWFLLGLVTLLVERMLLSLYILRLTKTGRLERRTVIVGGGPAADQLLEQLSAQHQMDLRICGIFDDRTDERSPDMVAGFPKLGTVNDLVEFARRVRLDLVIFTLPITAEARLLQMLRKLWVLPVDIRLAAHMNKLRFQSRAYSYIGTVPLLDVFDKPIADWDIVLKFLFDKIVGTLCLLIAAPVMVAVALAVKLTSKGPILFKQKRYGFNNELVEVLKFRSMYSDQLDYNAVKQVTRDDPRVTRVGRFIRKTSLDELPQLLNVVFKGNLSLVGPRPHAIHAMAAQHQYDDVVDGYFARHRVKPGITGWAQIHGWRGNTDTPEKIQKRVECDLYYIENWSILLDMYILLVTPFALLKAENAQNAY